MESGIADFLGPNIILVGGREVGKTTIFNRISHAQFPVSYVPSVRTSSAELSISLSDNKTKIGINVLDISSQCVDYDDNELHHLLEGVDGAVLVVDMTNADSFKDADIWVEILATYCPGIPKVLAVHKADCQERKAVAGEVFTDYIKKTPGFLEWAYTVGHASLIDFDPSRELWHKQQSPEVLLLNLTRSIMKMRKSKYILWPTASLSAISVKHSI